MCLSGNNTDINCHGCHCASRIMGWTLQLQAIRVALADHSQHAEDIALSLEVNVQVNFRNI